MQDMSGPRRRTEISTPEEVDREHGTRTDALQVGSSIYYMLPPATPSIHLPPQEPYRNTVSIRRVVPCLVLP